MISIIDPAVGRAGAPSYELEIVLDGSKPRIWRRLQAPGNANLGWLHAVIQVSMGWTNSHLHQFKIGEAMYSDTRHHFAEFEGDPEILEGRKFSLQQLAPREQESFTYTYDFGDSWEHLVTIKKILPLEPANATIAVCLDGARACPPEDCGGLWGYENLLKILGDRKHPEHRTMKEWLGHPIDAEAFDLARANRFLRKLKWPHVTEAQLCKVLMARDAYKE